MKIHLLAVVMLVAISVVVVQAQAPQAPKPGAEHKKLAPFVGSWSVDGETKPGNGYSVPPGKVSFVERYQWMPGEFFLQMNREGKGPAGEPIRHSIIVGYDPVAKKHTGTFYDFTGGLSMSGTWTNNGSTWMLLSSGRTADAKTFQERCTLAFAANGASWTIKCDTSTDGRNWSPSYEAKATKSRS